jgi:hypothetical protein
MLSDSVTRSGVVDRAIRAGRAAGEHDRMIDTQKLSGLATASCRTAAQLLDL